MNEQELINGLKQIDAIVAECRNPALTREDHDNGRIIMQQVVTRIKLSYKLEAEKAEAQKAEKDATVAKSNAESNAESSE